MRAQFRHRVFSDPWRIGNGVPGLSLNDPPHFLSPSRPLRAPHWMPGPGPDWYLPGGPFLPRKPPPEFIRLRPSHNPPSKVRSPTP